MSGKLLELPSLHLCDLSTGPASRWTFCSDSSYDRILANPVTKCRLTLSALQGEPNASRYFPARALASANAHDSGERSSTAFPAGSLM